MVNISNRRPAARAVRGRGFSLIELLVAVLVMGIGVLGVTALQMVSLQNNRMALERSDAVHLAYDMMDRIRANPDGDYDGVGVGDGPPAAGDCVGDGSDCSAGAMADFDVASWKCLLGDHRDDAVCDGLRGSGVLPDLDLQPGLPNGDGSIEVDGDVITVTVQWSGVDAAVQSVVIDSK